MKHWHHLLAEIDGIACSREDPYKGSIAENDMRRVKALGAHIGIYSQPPAPLSLARLTFCSDCEISNFCA